MDTGRDGSEICYRQLLPSNWEALKAYVFSFSSRLKKLEWAQPLYLKYTPTTIG